MTAFFAPTGFYTGLVLTQASDHSAPIRRAVPIPHPIPVPPPRGYLMESSPPYCVLPAQTRPVSDSRPTYEQSPPCYRLPSLPHYRPLPQSAEAILLLAPPPRYCHCICDAEGQIHLDGSCQPRKSRVRDVVVLVLIVLNVMVWAAVAWGFCMEGRASPVAGYEFRNIFELEQ